MWAHVIDPTGYAWNPFAIPMAVTALLALTTGLVVTWREGNSQVNLSFLLVACSIGMWLGAFALMYLATDPRVALWWAKAAYLGVPCIPSAIYQFTVAVLRLAPRHASGVRVSWLMSALFVVAIVGTDGLVAGLYRYPWGFYPRYGPLSIPYLIFFFGVLVCSLVLYGREYRQAMPGTAHFHRVRTFLVAFAIVYLGSFDYLAKFHVPLYPFGYLPVCIFLVLAARAIWRYHLVDLTPAFAAAEILNTMQGAVVVADLDGIIRLINRAASTLLGYRDAELLGHPVATVTKTRLPVATAASDAVPTEPSQREMVWVTKSGRALDVSVAAAPLRDRHQMVGVVYIAMEITERKQAAAKLDLLNQTLVQRAAELVAANQELERFNQLAVGREQRMVELKREVNRLAHVLGQPLPYDLSAFPGEMVAGAPR